MKKQSGHASGFLVTAAAAAVLFAGMSVARAESDQPASSETENERGAVEERIETARQVSPRDFDDHNYERIFSHRKQKAVEILLSDPEVNELAQSWISSFEAYDPLTNHLETVSIQGGRDLRIEGGIDDSFTVTVVDRQVAYGIIDRVKDELVALEITDPIDVTWTPWDREEAEEGGPERLETVIEHPEVSEYLEGKDWFPMFKVAEEITGYMDFPHGDVTPVAIYTYNDGHLSVVPAFLDVSEEGNATFLDWNVVERFVEVAPHRLAEDIKPKDASVLGEVPTVPFEKRPWFTAGDGFHRISEPPESFDQDGWRIEWAQPVTHGITMKASYRNKPVFEAMDSPSTYTGYDLPLREGRSIPEWYFPNHDPVFAGTLLFWDIHSVDFGGPGMLGKIDYPAEPGRPAGFRLRTHYHTGAHDKESVDFHSGIRFAPYNYDISFEFFEDGTFLPIWRRQGPGFVTEHVFAHADHHMFPDTEVHERVVQHYTSMIAMDVTPGTTHGAAVQIFDGEEWKTPEREFYLRGKPGMIARFANPAGSERIDIPLWHNTEITVVRRKADEIGPGEAAATRVVDEQAEKDFYHPVQYVDGEPVQNERVIAWLGLEAATGQMPHPSGLTSFAVIGEIQLKGY